MNRILYILAIMLVPIISGCSPKLTEGKVEVATDPTDVYQPRIIGGGVQALPKAVIYKTNGDYSRFVMARMNADHTQFTYFPAPTDISSQSAPIAYGDGWLLDRQGAVGEGTVFLDYTYGEYAKLKAVPSPEVLKAHVIPGARVTEYAVLPETLNQVLDALNSNGGAAKASETDYR